jgi:hypothetical protein
VENHPGRKKKREDKANKRREILQKYGNEYMDMVAALNNS